MIRMRDFLALLANQPFVPFRIHVSDGSFHEVGHPEFIKIAPSFVMVFRPKPDQPLFAIEGYNMISMLHVSRLEQLGLSEKTAGAN